MYFIFTHKDPISNGKISIIHRTSDGDCWLGLGEQDPDYLTWVAEGNTPEPWNPEPTEEES